MLRILLTGFEPFGGEKINPSGKIVKELSRTKFEGIILTCAILPVSYEKSIAVLQDYYSREEFDIALHVGQAGGNTAITIERLAVNILDSNHPDNENVIKSDCRIIENGADAYMTDLKVKEIVSLLKKNKIPTQLSYTAGQYICNEVYYYSLHNSRVYQNPKHALFVHIPFLPEQVSEKETKPVASMDLRLGRKAIKLIIENIEKFI